MCQEIAAARPAHAVDKAALAQLGEELLEIGQRNLLPRGDVGERHRPLAAALGEIDHRHDRVAAFGAELHGSALAARRLPGWAAGGALSLVAGASRACSSS